MNAPTDWVSAIAILASGLILGLMFIYWVRSRKSPVVPAEDLELRDLEAKRDVLIQQLRDLDDDSKLTPALRAEERTRLELETAHVLREIDRLKGRPALTGARMSTPAEAVPAAPANGRRAAMVGFAWGVISVVALGALGYFVMKSAKDREPGGGMGVPTGSMQPARPQQDPAIKELEAAVQKSPDDLNLRVNLARLYLERDNLMGVFDQTQFILKKQPNEPRALTYQALVRVAMGQVPQAAEMLQKATTLDPDFLDGWVALAWIRTQQGKPAEAEQAIQSAIKRHPEEKGRLEQVLAEMKTHRPGATQPSTGAPGELPPGHPTIDQDAPVPEQTGATSTTADAAMMAADTNAVHVTLDVVPAAKSKVTGSGILFIIARQAGVTAGPPVAVKRLSGATFPLTFDLSSADSMMGQPLPAKIRIEARLDADGDAATKTANDADVIADGVAAGSSVKLALK